MKKVSSLVAAMTLMLVVNSVWAGTERPVQPFMREKLNYARSILEGITLDKLDLAITNAVLLRDMNKTNAFLRLGNQDYIRRANNFQTKVDALIAAAKANNLEGATDAYTGVARSCVECHKTFRREQFIKGQEQKQK
jgi:cytochrome c556